MAVSDWAFDSSVSLNVVSNLRPIEVPLRKVSILENSKLFPNDNNKRYEIREGRGDERGEGDRRRDIRRIKKG